MAGSANNWFKPAAGPLKGQSVYLSRAQQQGMTPAGVSATNRRAAIQRLLGLGNLTAVGSANTQRPAAAAITNAQAQTNAGQARASAPVQAQTLTVRPYNLRSFQGPAQVQGDLAVIQMNRASGGGYAIVHAPSGRILVHASVSQQQAVAQMQAMNRASAWNTAGPSTFNQAQNATLAQARQALGPRPTPTTPPATPPASQQAPTPPAPAVPAPGARVTSPMAAGTPAVPTPAAAPAPPKLTPGAAVSFNGQQGTVNRLIGTTAMVRLPNGRYGLVDANGNPVGSAAGYANTSAARQAAVKVGGAPAPAAPPAGQAAPGAAPRARTPRAPAPAPVTNFGTPVGQSIAVTRSSGASGGQGQVVQHGNRFAVVQLRDGSYGVVNQAGMLDGRSVPTQAGAARHMATAERALAAAWQQAPVSGTPRPALAPDPRRPPDLARVAAALDSNPTARAAIGALSAPSPYAPRDPVRGNQMLDALYTAHGFHSKPDVMPKAVFDAHLVGGSFQFELFRNSGGAQYETALKSSDVHYAGNGVYGQGTYTTRPNASRSGALGFTRKWRRGGQFSRMALKPDAKTGEYRVLDAERTTWASQERARIASEQRAGRLSARDAQTQLNTVAAISADTGYYAAYRGYDAYRVTDYHGNGNEVWVVLNRGSLVIQQELET